MTDAMAKVLARLKAQQAKDDGAQAAKDIVAADRAKRPRKRRKPRARVAPPPAAETPAAATPAPAATQPEAPAPIPEDVGDGEPRPGDVVTYIHREGRQGESNYRAEMRTRVAVSVDLESRTFDPRPYKWEADALPAQSFDDIHMIDRRTNTNE